LMSSGLEAVETPEEARLLELCGIVNGLRASSLPPLSYCATSKASLRLSSSFSRRRILFSCFKSSVLRERAAVRVSPTNVS
jgi:hypothetical protein